MDLAMEQRHLEEAERHIADGERLVAEQEARLAELDRDGHETIEACKLLEILLGVQAQYINTATSSFKS